MCKKGNHYYIDILREAQKKKMTLSLNTIMPDAQKWEVICLPTPTLLLEFNKVKWKHAILSAIVLAGLMI